MKKDIGIYAFGLGTLAAGIMDFVWGEFETGHQPIQALGDHIPGREIFAYLAAAWMVAAGLAVLWRRTARFGALASATIYSIFAAFCSVRLYSGPHALGMRLAVFLGVFGGIEQQLILVAGAMIVYFAVTPGPSLWSRPMRLIVRAVFGLSSLNFGINHIGGVKFVVPLIQKWMPLTPAFWVILSGIAFILAGLAILSGIMDVLAARLLALMLLIFNALVLVPAVFTYPHAHVPWGSNAYNLAAAGAVYIFAESITKESHGEQEERGSELVKVA
jgi:uncharacterized membrane protein YphA (DoxX/SURF4 family)